jgi:hypothetical protein
MIQWTPRYRRGGRPRKTDSEKRRLLIAARVRPDELAIIEGRAAEANFPLSDFLREQALTGAIIVRRSRRLSPIDRHAAAVASRQAPISKSPHFTRIRNTVLKFSIDAQRLIGHQAARTSCLSRRQTTCQHEIDTGRRKCPWGNSKFAREITDNRRNACRSNAKPLLVILAAGKFTPKALGFTVLGAIPVIRLAAFN